MTERLFFGRWGDPLLLPVDPLNAFTLKVGVRLAEMLAAEEAMVGGTGRRMHGCQHEVLMGVDKGDLLFRIASPQHEYEILPFVAQFLYYGIRKSFPAHIPV